MSEINHLEWKDVDLEQRELILYTRKKKGSHLTPRKVPITKRLHAILIQRFQDRDKNKPWVFWHRYFSKKDSAYMEGPYRDRKRLMRTLCEKAGVKYFRFHAFRHAGATVMDNNNVPLGAIQSILGHENRSTTEIYVHALGNSARNAMDIYESATKVSHTDSHTETKKHLETLL
jgi:integrase